MFGITTTVISPYSYSQQDTDTASSRDMIVLEIVLADLMSYSGSDSPLKSFVVCRRTDADGHKPLLLSQNTLKWKPNSADVLDRQADQEMQWRALTNSEYLLTQAATNLVSRATPEHSLGNLEFTNTAIEVVASEHQSTRFERPIHVWLPGYSDDGTLSIVRLSIPWSLHHADGTYVLIQTNAEWRIVLRQFVYYL